MSMVFDISSYAMHIYIKHTFCSACVGYERTFYILIVKCEEYFLY